MKKKNLTFVVIGIVIVVGILAAVLVPRNQSTAQGRRQGVETPATALVERMGAGWNLGNALEAIDSRKVGIVIEPDHPDPVGYYETLWNNPPTTGELIKTVADAGFKSVRVPVTYADHMDENYQISEDWLNRVEVVVNYVLDNNMLCIINLHHDVGSGAWPWLNANLETIELDEQHLRTVWLQIATHFQDYGDDLIFEGFNEILDVDDQWSDADATAYEAVNRLNQTFVDTVRSLPDSNNQNRFLVVNTYAASVEAAAVENFVVPQDAVEGHLIVGVHCYNPMEFTWPQEQVTWTVARSNWDSTKDSQALEKIMQRLWDQFSAQGVPVIISEYGAWNKENPQDRATYAADFVRTAYDFGYACFWWDRGENDSTTALLNREKNDWYHKEIVEAMIIASA